jgi:hypothetical protein
MIMKNYLCTLCLVGLAVFSSCRKLIDVPTPQNLLTINKVFSDTSAATAAMVNCYSLFDQSINPNFNLNMETYVDELDNSTATGTALEFCQSKISSTNGTDLNIWSLYYNEIYQCNSIIEQLQPSKLPVSVITAYTAEAKFLRAYAYFYLVNTYGSVPLILITDVNSNKIAAQADSLIVYKQIITDLKDAQNGLSDNYADGGKVRANKMAATALLARVYLYQRDWQNAQAASAAVINSGLYSLDGLNTTFLANSNETILQFWNRYGYIADGVTLIPVAGNIPEYLISNSLLNDFEPGDLRKTIWVDSTTLLTGGTTATYFYPYKYRNTPANVGPPEYLTALRLSEQYLIRAEAQIEKNTNLPSAIADINMIRQRAGLPLLSPSLNKSACLTAVYREWRMEFFTEWANRYLDLKRRGQLNPVMAAYRTTWLPRAVVLPIPQTEITKDINLKQNQGY